MKLDYNEYHVSMRERCLYIGQGILLCVIVNYLCYRSIPAFLFMIPVPMLWFRLRVQERNQKRKKELNYQFRNALSFLSAALRAGYSMENGLVEVEKDMRRLNGNDAEMVQELSYMNQQIKVSIPVEELLMDFGKRSNLEDVMDFASIVTVARVTGGDLSSIMGDCVNRINEKIDVDKSIETAVASKKFEQSIMSVMPCGIIFYMQITSPGYFDELYGTLFGVIFMTICLILYVISFWMGRRIVSIEV